MTRSSKKIVFICDDLMLGGWTSLAALALELKRRGERVSFITLFGKGYNADLLQKNGIAVHCLFLKKTNLPFALVQLFFLLRREKPDIVHTHLHFSDCFGIPIAYLAGVKKRVVHIHSIGEKYRHKLSLLRHIAYRLLSRAIAVSSAAARYFKEETPFCSTEIDVIHNGIDICEFRRRVEGSTYTKSQFSVEENEFVVLCVANFKWQKGHEFLLHAARELRGEKFKFLLVGCGPEKERIMKRANEEGLRDTVIFLHLRTDIPELMKIADCLLLPSLAESFGICIIEAFAAGVPVIASCVDGIKEVAKSGENAILTDAGKPEPGQICEALRTLKKNPNLRAKIVENAGRSVEDFDIAKIADQIDVFYHKL